MLKIQNTQHLINKKEMKKTTQISSFCILFTILLLLNSAYSLANYGNVLKEYGLLKTKINIQEENMRMGINNYFYQFVKEDSLYIHYFGYKNVVLYKISHDKKFENITVVDFPPNISSSINFSNGKLNFAKSEFVVFYDNYILFFSSWAKYDKFRFENDSSSFNCYPILKNEISFEKNNTTQYFVFKIPSNVVIRDTHPYFYAGTERFFSKEHNMEIYNERRFLIDSIISYLISQNTISIKLLVDWHEFSLSVSK